MTCFPDSLHTQAAFPCDQTCLQYTSGEGASAGLLATPDSCVTLHVQLAGLWQLLLLLSILAIRACSCLRFVLEQVMRALERDAARQARKLQVCPLENLQETLSISGRESSLNSDHGSILNVG